jgi:hypothetical protein
MRVGNLMLPRTFGSSIPEDYLTTGAGAMVLRHTFYSSDYDVTEATYQDLVGSCDISPMPVAQGFQTPSGAGTYLEGPLNFYRKIHGEDTFFFAIWFYVPGGVTQGVIWNGGANLELAFGYTGTMAVNASVFTNGPGLAVCTSGPNKVVAGKWNYLLVVYDNTLGSEQIKVYDAEDNVIASGTTAGTPGGVSVSGDALMKLGGNGTSVGFGMIAGYMAWGLTTPSAATRAALAAAEGTESADVALFTLPSFYGHAATGTYYYSTNWALIPGTSLNDIKFSIIGGLYSSVAEEVNSDVAGVTISYNGTSFTVTLGAGHSLASGQIAGIRIPDILSKGLKTRIICPITGSSAYECGAGSSATSFASVIGGGNLDSYIDPDSGDLYIGILGDGSTTAGSADFGFMLGYFPTQLDDDAGSPVEAGESLGYFGPVPTTNWLISGNTSTPNVNVNGNWPLAIGNDQTIAVSFRVADGYYDFAGSILRLGTPYEDSLMILIDPYESYLTIRVDTSSGWISSMFPIQADAVYNLAIRLGMGGGTMTVYKDGVEWTSFVSVEGSISSSTVDAPTMMEGLGGVDVFELRCYDALLTDEQLEAVSQNLRGPS